MKVKSRSPVAHSSLQCTCDSGRFCAVNREETRLFDQRPRRAWLAVRERIGAAFRHDNKLHARCNVPTDVCAGMQAMFCLQTSEVAYVVVLSRRVCVANRPCPATSLRSRLAFRLVAQKGNYDTLQGRLEHQDSRITGITWREGRCTPTLPSGKVRFIALNGPAFPFQAVSKSGSMIRYLP